MDYCLANIALEIKPITRDGVKYYPINIYAVSAFSAYSETEDEETVYTYVGTSINKMIEAKWVEDSIYTVTVPRSTGFAYEGDMPDGYFMDINEFIMIIYEDEDTNAITKIQPIYIKQN